jgi:oxygen-dependent protoporphyrinogen oxidase
MLGVPTDFSALKGLISDAGIERAKLDLSLPATPISSATSVDDYCRARLGDEVTDILVDPLVGGINASSIEHLSFEQGAAQLFAAAQRSPSLVEGLRAARSSVGATLGSAGKDEPVFHGLEGGMATLIEVLVDRLEPRSDLRLRSPLVELPPGFDSVIVATEAHAAARLMKRQQPEASELIDQIHHATVAQVTMEIPKGQIEPLDASGIFVPRTEGMLMTACTWFSTKWAQYASPDHFLVRITSGRFHDQRAALLGDTELVNRLTQDFATVYADPGKPHSVRVVRWPNAFPQYQPGHAALVDEIDGALSESNVKVIGNSYRGIGIPATIKLARQTAAAVLG